MIPTRLRTVLAILCGSLMAACNANDDADKAPIVLAASSLQEAMTEAADEWSAQGHIAPALSFAGSSSLARQIESGAKADIFVSADEDWMLELERKGFVRDGSQHTLIGNEIVLIAPEGSGSRVQLNNPASALTALGDSGRLAMADPEAVPAGRYGKAALESLGIWEAVSTRIAPAENVRAALALVERGQAPLGIVYATDALASDKVAVLARFPAGSHPPVRYPAAILKTSTNADAAPFLDYLRSDEARRIFLRHGFTIP